MSVSPEAEDRMGASEGGRDEKDPEGGAQSFLPHCLCRAAHRIDMKDFADLE